MTQLPEDTLGIDRRREARIYVIVAEEGYGVSGMFSLTKIVSLTHAKEILRAAVEAPETRPIPPTPKLPQKHDDDEDRA